MPWLYRYVLIYKSDNAHASVNRGVKGLPEEKGALPNGDRLTRMVTTGKVHQKLVVSKHFKHPQCGQ